MSGFVSGRLPFPWCLAVSLGLVLAWEALPVRHRARCNGVGVTVVCWMAMLVLIIAFAWSLACAVGGRAGCRPSLWCCLAASLWLIAVWDVLVRWESRVQGNRDARWLAPEHGGYFVLPLWAGALLGAFLWCGVLLALQAAGLGLCMGGSVAR